MSDAEQYKKDAVYKVLRDEQAGSRSNRNCNDQIATLRIIMEKSVEWQSPLNIDYFDFEKPLAASTEMECANCLDTMKYHQRQLILS